jgi:hypothetical protein
LPDGPVALLIFFIWASEVSFLSCAYTWVNIFGPAIAKIERPIANDNSTKILSDVIDFISYSNN